MDLSKMRPSQVKAMAAQLRENELVTPILNHIERVAVDHAIYAKDEIARAEACYRARAARAFRDELASLIASLAEKGEAE